jgi:replicative DNA helicase
MGKTENEYERAALGAVLLDPNQVIPFAVNAGITSEMFYEARHETIMAALLALFASGRPVDTLTLADYLTKKGELEKSGGLPYFNELLEAVPSAAHGAYYLGLVRQDWVRRQIVQITGALQSRAKGGEDPEQVALAGAHEFAGVMGDMEKTEKTPEEIITALIAGWRAVRSGEKKPGLETPFPKLNELLGGGLRTGLYLVAGRPSQGKSVLEENIAMAVAKSGAFVGRIAIDMPVSVVWARTLAREGGVSLPKLNFGHAGESQLARLDELKESIASYPCIIKGNLFDVSAIASWARAMKAKNDMKLMTVDYIQNIQINAPGASHWQEVQKMTYISGVLKRLALELDIPVMAVSQLTRDNERDDRPPRLSDLRGSGSLEQDATVVIFVYRDEKAAKKMGWDEQKKKRPVNVDIQKQQNGETGIVQCWMHAHYFTFEETGPDGFGIEYD